MHKWKKKYREKANEKFLTCHLGIGGNCYFSVGCVTLAFIVVEMCSSIFVPALKRDKYSGNNSDASISAMSITHFVDFVHILSRVCLCVCVPKTFLILNRFQFTKAQRNGWLRALNNLVARAEIGGMFCNTPCPIHTLSNIINGD